MNETLRELLIDFLDGSLPPSQRVEVEQLIAADPQAARFVREHQQVWDALDDAYGAPDVEASEDFRTQVASQLALSGGRRPWPLQRLLALAACLALGLTLFTWLLEERSSGLGLSREDQQVVRYLHVLREYDVVETLSSELDLRAEYDVMRAFEGELEG